MLCKYPPHSLSFTELIRSINATNVGQLLLKPLTPYISVVKEREEGAQSYYLGAMM